MNSLADGLDVAAGTVVDGKYRVEALLGEGGMGVVVRAMHLPLGRPVALKFLHRRVLADAVAVERFMRESRAAGRLTSEHVARVLDVGSLPGGAPYMVLEYLEGLTLAALLEQRGALPIGEACGYMLQVCDALSEAHDQGIIHRDLKLANLFLAQRPNGRAIVKVLDFGISKVVGEASGMTGRELTLTSSVLGTPHYMAPEQLRASHAVDARADIWSFGVCLFRLLTASVPFEAESLIDLGIKLVTAAAPDVRTLRIDVPQPLATVVSKCLEREPAARWSSARQLGSALAPFAELPAAALETLARTQPFFTPTPIGEASQFERPPESVTMRTAPTRENERSGAPFVEGRTGIEFGRTYASAATSRRRSKPAALAGLLVLALVAGGSAIVWRTTMVRKAQATASPTPTQASAESPQTAPAQPPSAPAVSTTASSADAVSASTTRDTAGAPTRTSAGTTAAPLAPRSAGTTKKLPKQVSTPTTGPVASDPIPDER